MYLHKVPFAGHVKLLLRYTQRIGPKTVKVTLANVSKWSPSDIDELQSSLAYLRRCRGLEKRLVREWIIGLVAERVGTSSAKFWRVFSEPIGTWRPLPRKSKGSTLIQEPVEMGPLDMPIESLIHQARRLKNSRRS